MPTRSATCSTWSSSCGGGARAPAAARSRTRSSTSCWRSGSRPRVDSSRISRLGIVHERGDDAHFLLVALREVADPAARGSSSSAWRARRYSRRPTPPRRPTEEREKVDRRASRGHFGAPGDSPSAAAPRGSGLRVSRPAIAALPARRSDEVEEQPDRRRLAGPVQSQVAERLAPLDAQLGPSMPRVSP